ncbi:MAG: hypothetical protein DCC75_05430, partial [Proteobacteria bacterium]
GNSARFTEVRQAIEHLRGEHGLDCGAASIIRAVDLELQRLAQDLTGSRAKLNLAINSWQQLLTDKLTLVSRSPEVMRGPGCAVVLDLQSCAALGVEGAAILNIFISHDTMLNHGERSKYPNTKRHHAEILRRHSVRLHLNEIDEIEKEIDLGAERGTERRKYSRARLLGLIDGCRILEGLPKAEMGESIKLDQFVWKQVQSHPAQDGEQLILPRFKVTGLGLDEFAACGFTVTSRVLPKTKEEGRPYQYVLSMSQEPGQPPRLAIEGLLLSWKGANGK